MSGAQVLYCETHVPATPEQAAAAVLDAALAENQEATGEQLAEAERNAGILFDATSIDAAVAAAVEQTRTEYAAEFAEVRKQLAVMAGARRQRDAVLRLCEGHRGDDLLLVSVVAAAAECGTTALDGLPMTLAWTRRAHVPDAHTTRKRVVVECTSSYGGRADLVVEGDDRMALGSLLVEEAHDVHATCPTDGCGTVDDYDASDPALIGWARLEVAGIESGPRWYCSPQCVSAALARAGDELALADQAAAVDPDEQDPRLLLAAPAPAAFEAERDDAAEGGAW